jgi:predicted HTH domain antitoxin
MVGHLAGDGKRFSGDFWPDRWRAVVVWAESLRYTPRRRQTMPITISDDLLREAGLTERDALVEFAGQLFASGRLSLWSAAKWAGMTRAEFEEELLQRNIPIYRPEIADLTDDLGTLDRLGK